jgi:malic enzyme
VAKAAAESGVARRPIKNIEDYREKLVDWRASNA